MRAVLSLFGITGAVIILVFGVAPFGGQAGAEAGATPEINAAAD